MSLAVHTSVDIDASPQQVWDVVMDPRRLESWVTTHEKASRAPERLSSGSSFEQTLRLAGRSFDVAGPWWRRRSHASPNGEERGLAARGPASGTSSNRLTVRELGSATRTSS